MYYVLVVLLVVVVVVATEWVLTGRRRRRAPSVLTSEGPRPVAPDVENVVGARVAEGRAADAVAELVARCDLPLVVARLYTVLIGGAVDRATWERSAIDPVAAQEILDALDDQRKILAIKLLRKASPGMRLQEAKNAMDWITAD